MCCESRATIVNLEDTPTVRHPCPGMALARLVPNTGLTDLSRCTFKKQRASLKSGVPFKPKAIELRKGECSFHHPLMVHGSFENRTDQPRRAAVINVVRDGVVSASDQPLLEGVPRIPAGERLGQFFSLLCDPSSVR